MSANPEGAAADTPRNTASLFARVSRNSERIIIPINDSALNPANDLPAIYCLHDITGAAGSEYVDLAQRLDKDVRFYGVQAPPKKMQDPRFGESIESLAACYAEALQRFQPTGPFFVGGFCAGAIVALEIAQQLVVSGRQVGLLVAIDAAPENTHPEWKPWYPTYLLALARNVPGWIQLGGLTRQKDGHSLGRRIAHSAIALGRSALGHNPTQNRAGEYSIDGWMDLTRYPIEQRQFINRFYAACFKYFAKDYHGEVVIYEANTKPLFHLPQLHSRWRGIAPRAVTKSVPGTHHCLMREPYVISMARDVPQRIQAYLAASSDRTQ
jgi:thioesterase domain-containing protein